MRRIVFALLILGINLEVGCAPQTVLVPPGVVVRTGQPVAVKVYTWNGSAWVLSAHAVTIPEGYYVGQPPAGATTLPAGLPASD